MNRDDDPFCQAVICGPLTTTCEPIAKVDAKANDGRDQERSCNDDQRHKQFRGVGRDAREGGGQHDFDSVRLRFPIEPGLVLSWIRRVVHPYEGPEMFV